MIDTLKNSIIYIYGMGEYGIDIFLRLRDMEISVKSFIDGNKQKWSRSLYNTPCVGIQEVPQNESNIVIIGIRDSAHIISDLKKMGFKRVLSYQEVQNVIYEPWCNAQIKNYGTPLDEIEQFRTAIFSYNRKTMDGITNNTLLNVYGEIEKQRSI